MRSWTLLLHVLLASLAAVVAVSCSDDSTTPTSNAECDGETLSIALDAPEPNAGFAPLSSTINGKVSLIRDVSYSWTLDFGDGTSQQGSNSQPRALNSYENEGSYAVTLTVNDETCGNTVTDSAVIEVYPPVELEVNDLTGRPGNVQTHGELQVSMKVSNESDNDLKLPVAVDVFLSPMPGVVWEDVQGLVPLLSTSVEPDATGTSIAGGRQVTITETVTVPRAVLTGSYYLIGAVDVRNEIGEDDDRTNNLVASDSPIFIENLAEDGSDLVVEDVQVGPSSAFMRLSNLVVNADIKNIGTTFADEVSFAVYVQTGSSEWDSELARRVYTSDPADIRNLDFNEGQNVFRVQGLQITLSNPIELEQGEGSAEVWVFVVVDPDNTIAEGPPESEDTSAEENNRTVALNPIVLSDEPVSGTDIVLLDFDFAPAATFIDGFVQLTLTVANFGTDGTRSFFCSVILSEDETLDPEDIRLTNVNLSNIDPADEPRVVEQNTTIPGFIPTGSYTAFAQCDPSDVVRETFEDNNIARFPGQVTITSEAIIDLSATDVVFDPLTLDDGGDMTVSLTVHNEGENGAGPSVVEVYRSLQPGISDADELIGSADVPPIEPGGDAEVQLTINALTCEIFEKEYNIGLKIDATNVINEVDETNNVFEAGRPLSFVGDRCVCTEDFYEDNDSPQACAPVTDGLIPDLAICTDDDPDFYCVDLVVGESLSVDVTMVHEGDSTNLDLRILDPNYQQIPTAISRSDGPIESAAVFLVQQQGRYIVEVSSRGAGDVNEYEMDVDITAPSGGVDLTGTNLAIDDANPALGQSVTGVFRTLNIGNDAAGPYDVEVYLTTDTEIDVSDFLLQTLHVDSLDGARTREDTLGFTIPVDAVDGNYYVCAFIDSADAIAGENAEDNNVVCSEQILVDTACYDPFEENDTPETATEITSGVLTNLNVCRDMRDDYYRFCATDGQRADITVDFLHADGDVDVQLLSDGPAYNEIDSSTGVRDSEELTIDYVGGDQCYLIRVYLNDPLRRDPDGSNDYTLTLAVTNGDPLLRCSSETAAGDEIPSLYEPNDDVDAAAASGSSFLDAINEGYVLDRCPQTDADFYYLDLVAGPEITLCADNADSNPDEYSLSIALFDPTDSQVAAFVGTNPCITHTVQVSGRYVVRVLALDSYRAIRYTLSLDGLLGTDLVGRDLHVQPTEIIPGETILIYDFVLQNARSVRAENVTYGVYYSADGPIIDPDVDLLLETRSVGGVDGFSETLVEDLFIVDDNPAFVPGTGTIGIYIDPNDTVDEVNENNNRLQSDVQVLVCYDDVFEGNSLLGTAAAISSGAPIDDMMLCPGLDDWYCADGLPAGQYRANASFALDPGDRLGTDLNIQAIEVDASHQSLGILGNELAIGDNADLAFTLAAPGNVCFKVYGTQPKSSNSYDLTLLGPLSAGVDLQPAGLSVTPVDVVPGLSTIEVSFQVQNNATDIAGEVTYDIYYTTDGAIDPATDVLLASDTVNALGAIASVNVTKTIAVADDMAILDGVGSIGVLLDGANAVAENDETNNDSLATITVFRCVEDALVGNQALADAAPIDLDTDYDDLAICSGTEDYFCFTAEHAGPYAIDATFTLDPGSEAFTDLDLEAFTVNGAQSRLVDLGAAEGVADSASLVANVTTDNTDVCVRVYAPNPEGTNTYSLRVTRPILIDVQPENLVVAPVDLVPDLSSFSVDFDVHNVGSDPAGTVDYEVIYSADATLDGGDLLLDSGTTAALDADGSEAVSTTLTLPDNVDVLEGAGTFFVSVDSTGTLDETDEANNTAHTAITVFRCTEDALVGNQTLAAAATIAVDTDVADLAICSTTEDYLCFDAVTAGAYTIEATFALTAGSESFTDLDLEAFTVDGSMVRVDDLGTSTGVADDATLEVTTTADNTNVCIRIYAAAAEGTNTYSVHVTGP